MHAINDNAGNKLPGENWLSIFWVATSLESAFKLLLLGPFSLRVSSFSRVPISIHLLIRKTEKINNGIASEERRKWKSKFQILNWKISTEIEEITWLDDADDSDRRISRREWCRLMHSKCELEKGELKVEP